MKLMAGAVIVFLALASDLRAQPAAPPVESVTVTGERLKEKQIQDFVASRAAPTVRLGKIARWNVGLCPVATGLKPELLNFIVQRVKDVAARVGAPVRTDATCRANVEIVFSSVPQAVLDGLRKTRESYLGYHDNGAQADAMAKFNHAIQSWYATGTMDVRGYMQLDAPQKGPPFCLDEPECRIMVSNATNYAVTGSRLGDGLRSGLLNVIIVADRNKLVDHEIGALADYIAFLALAQPRSLDDCEPLPSILDLLAPGCGGAVVAREITNTDIGYLRGLYHMTPDATLRGQRDEISYQMEQTLGGK